LDIRCGFTTVIRSLSFNVSGQTPTVGFRGNPTVMPVTATVSLFCIFRLNQLQVPDNNLATTNRTGSSAHNLGL
jgi:hypothetical protein